MRKRCLGVGVALWLAVVAAPASAADPQRLSGGDPGCGSRDLQAEPSIAVNPRDRQHVVAAWVDDDAGIVASTTRDGGESWSRKRVPYLTTCLGGEMDYVSHPRLAFDGDGGLFLASFPKFADGMGTRTRVLVSHSPDGGANWEAPVRADFGAPDAFNDFSSFAAAPDGDLFVSWAPMETNLAAQTAFVARSSDGGDTWSQHPVRAALPGHAIWSRLVALRDGSLVFVYQEPTPADLFSPVALPARVYAMQSSDDGATWSPPAPLGDSTALQWPSAAEAPDGAVYVSWVRSSPGGTCRRIVVDGRERNVGGRCEVVVTRSSDAQADDDLVPDARAWTPPVVVGAWDGPWMPTPGLAVAADGTVGVLRTSAAASTATVTLSRSFDGGESWTHEELSQFSLAGVPAPEGLGLYHELAPRGCGFAAAFAQAEGTEEGADTDVFASLRRSSVPGTPPTLPGCAAR